MRRPRGVLAALALFASAAGLEAGVKVVVGADGEISVVHDGAIERRTPLRGVAPAPPATPASPPSYETLIQRFAREHALDERLVEAVIQVESDFDPVALSNKGAMGLMQLMPETARELEVSDPWDPEENVRGGTRYLSRMLELFGGRLEPALAAYNAGPSAVRRFGGVPPYPETRRYVEKVMRIYRGEASYKLTATRGRAGRGRPTYVYRDAQGRLTMSTLPPSAGG